jgi:hypothetical protein
MLVIHNCSLKKEEYDLKEYIVPKKIFAFHSWEYIYPEMQHSKRDLDYGIPIRIRQTSIPNPKYIF